ncbi:MAG: hypothetical protein WCX79_03745 [Candidatus Paceibacterota bacterium]|jgi:hypothetical protein
MQRDPWDRLDREPSEQYIRFCVYRDLGPGRTIGKAYAKLCEEYGKAGCGPRRLEKIATRYKWVKRSRAYDDHLEKIRREDHEKELKAMFRRHKSLGLGLQQFAGKKLEKILKDKETLDKAADDLGPTFLPLLIGTGIKIERQAAGIPDDYSIEDLTPPVTDDRIARAVEEGLERMSDKQREEYLRDDAT